MSSENNRELSERLQDLLSFSEILSYTTATHPDQEFLASAQKSWTYEQFNGLVNQCSHFLQDIGLESGDILSAVLRNSLDYLVLYFACVRCRIIFNPFPFHVHANEIIKKVESFDVKILVCHNEHFPGLADTKVKLINFDDVD